MILTIRLWDQHPDDEPNMDHLALLCGRCRDRRSCSGSPEIAVVKSVRLRSLFEGLLGIYP
jgi:hypothetical protein